MSPESRSEQHQQGEDFQSPHQHGKTENQFAGLANRRVVSGDVTSPGPRLFMVATTAEKAEIKSSRLPAVPAKSARSKTYTPRRSSTRR